MAHDHSGRVRNAGRVDWSDLRRPLETIGHVLPAELEMRYLHQRRESALLA